MPNEEKPLPEDTEEELSRITAEAAEKLLQQNTAEMQQQEAMKQQQDPLTQIQQRELAINEQELMHKKQMDLNKNILLTTIAPIISKQNPLRCFPPGR